MLLRVLIPGLFVAGILVVLLKFIFNEADHRARMKRSERYNEWVKTVPSMTPDDRQIAQLHIVRVLREGPKGEYRGPWEDVPKA